MGLTMSLRNIGMYAKTDLEYPTSVMQVNIFLYSCVLKKPMQSLCEVNCQISADIHEV